MFKHNFDSKEGIPDKQNSMDKSIKVGINVICSENNSLSIGYEMRENWDKTKKKVNSRLGCLV